MIKTVGLSSLIEAASNASKVRAHFYNLLFVASRQSEGCYLGLRGGG